jgi:hypothetical protein
MIGNSDIEMENTDGDDDRNNGTCTSTSSGDISSDRIDGSDTRKVYITDVKTRSSPHLPKNAAIRPTVMQLHIYHRLLSDLAAGAVDVATLFDRYQLDPLAPLSDEFVAAVSALEGEWDVEDEDGIVAPGSGSSDDNEAGDADYVPSPSPAASSGSSSPARRPRRRKIPEHPQSREERSSGGGGGVDGSADVRSADAVSESVSTGTAVAADSGSSLSSSPSASQTPFPTPAMEGVDAESYEAPQCHSPSPSPAYNDTSTTAATALLLQQQQQSPITLLTLWQRLQRAVRVTLPHGRASVGAVLRVEYRRAADGAVLGERLLAHDAAHAGRYLRDALAWWRGARPAVGVPVEEAFKCRTCEFAPRCAWRASKLDEAVARFRARHPRARSTV